MEINKNKSIKSYFPIVVFIELNDETGFFYSQKRIQTNVTDVDLHRRSDCVVSLREEYALCNPPFLYGKERNAPGQRMIASGCTVAFALACVPSSRRRNLKQSGQHHR
ncbi:MAG: hypothetical protein LBG15_01110 [Dysgonamonadaceae bacterium]|nr:hypothetical protein [Dysgonamonadaceae bacterium]